MAKYVYTNRSRVTWKVKFKDFGLKNIKICLRSAYKDGRIIADDNILEGM